LIWRRFVVKLGSLAKPGIFSLQVPHGRDQSADSLPLDSSALVVGSPKLPWAGLADHCASKRLVTRGVRRGRTQDLQFDRADRQSIARHERRIDKAATVEPRAPTPAARHGAADTAQNNTMDRPDSGRVQSQRASSGRTDCALGRREPNHLPIACGADDAQAQVTAGDPLDEARIRLPSNRNHRFPRTMNRKMYTVAVGGTPQHSLEI
jgi:hypothetical protein